MNIKNTYWMFLIWFSISLSYSQNLIPSTTYLQLCYNKKACFSIANSSLIFFNNQNNELILQVDFDKFKTGNDTLDEWLNDLEHRHLVFKGHLNTNNLLLLSHHNSKPIMVNGIVTFNGISKPHTIELNIFEISNAGILFNNNSQDYFDRVNINTQLAFFTKDFNINKHYKKTITIALYRGYINELKPEMESLIKDRNK